MKIQCSNKTYIICINLDHKEQEKLAGEIQFLASTRIFANCSYNWVKSIYYHSSITTFQRGMKVYKEGDIADNLFFIKSGEFKVYH